MDFVNFNESRNILIITSSGGSGHLQAAAAIEAYAKELPNVKLKKIDLLKELGIGKIGGIAVNQWDQALKMGDIDKQIYLVNKKWLAEALFVLPIYFKILYLLWKYEIDLIVDTQPLGTKAIVHAAYTVNRANEVLKRNLPKITVSKIMTDLPTDKATHFYDAIKLLDKEERQIFELVTTIPLLKNGETDQDFWKKHCNLSIKQVRYANLPLRSAFNRYTSPFIPNKPKYLKVKFNTEDEFNLVKSCLGKDRLEYTINSDGKKVIQNEVAENDQVFTVLLGGQAVIEATLEYVKKMIRWARRSKHKDSCFHLYVFCSKHISGQNTLFKQICNLTIKTKDFPKNLHVIPLALQDDTEVAPILFRSDVIIIRSGGMASMEVLKIVNGKAFIHSEVKNATRKSTQHELLKGIALWEAGNAEYLIKMKHAIIVTPKSILSELSKVKFSNK